MDAELEDVLRRLSEASLESKAKMEAYIEESRRSSEEFKQLTEKHIQEIRHGSEELRERTDQQIQESRRSTEELKQRTEQQIQESRRSTEELKQRTEQQIQESRRSSEEFKQRTEQQIRESHRSTEELKQRTEQQIQESRRSSEEFKQRTEQQIQESRRSSEEFKAWAKDTIKEIHRTWGHLANKLGTILEDIAAPNIKRMALEEFNFQTVDDLMVRITRVSRIGPRRQLEFDVICAGPERVIYAEMKSSPSLEDLRNMQLKLQEFHLYFPEYRDRELIGIFCSWSLDEKLRKAVSSAGLYGAAMGETTMDIVARPL